MSRPFCLPVRVYYEDTDAAGIVYHARYLHFAERGRTEMLREVGFDHITLKRELDVVFAVQRCDIHFRLAAFLDDALDVQSYVVEQRGARLEFDQRIMRGDTLICRLSVMLAVLNGAMRPRRLPAALADAFAQAKME